MINALDSKFDDFHQAGSKNVRKEVLIQKQSMCGLHSFIYYNSTLKSLLGVGIESKT